MKTRATMAILKANSKAISVHDETQNRVFPVTTKLTKEEQVSITEFAKAQGLARGEWIRDVILREVRGASASNPLLAEILGVRLLLVNVLRPLATGETITPAKFDQLLDQIGETKHQLAAKLQQRVHEKSPPDKPSVPKR
jgi:hypothetical protein